MSVYYNENDRFAAQWLRNLIAEGLIADGEVDERSIELVQPGDLRGFKQCHFFAGIGGWSYALRLAGWPDDRPVWTGSCPCQPFSQAGKRKGFADERHLWPEWFRLIRECKPNVIFGKQVASALGWFDLVSADLESEGYACGAAIVGAHSVGRPHIRQRLYFVADANSERFGEARYSSERCGVGGSGIHGVGQADTTEQGWSQRTPSQESDGRDTTREQPGRLRNVGSLAHGQEIRCRQERQNSRRMPARDTEEGISRGFDSSGMGHSQCEGLEERRSIPGDHEQEQQAAERTGMQWITCLDGKRRPIPVEPTLFPLAHGISNRLGLLRGAGNAICPQTAQAFIESYMEVVD